MFNQKDIYHLFILKDIAATAVAASKITKYTDLADGEAVLVTESDYVMVPSGTYDPGTIGKARIIQRSGTSLITSPLIRKANIRRWSGKLGSAAQQQVDYIGYNGTSGEMDVDTYTQYTVKILQEDTTTTFGNKQMWKFGGYKTGGTVTQSAVALGLCDNLIKNFAHEAENLYHFEVVCSAAVTGHLGHSTTTHVVGYKGEDFITITDDGTAATVGITVGDYIRIGASTTGIPMYKVVSGTTANTGGVLYLDRPLQADYSTLHGETSHYILGATAEASDFGIKISGLARTNFRPGVFKTKTTKFQTMLSDTFETATVTKSTAWGPGIGTYEQVAELEWFEAGNRGKVERLGVPPPTFKTDAVSGTVYDMFCLEYYDDSYKGSITAATQSPQQIYIAIDNGYDNTEAGDLLIEAIDDLAIAGGLVACGLAK